MYLHVHTCNREWLRTMYRNSISSKHFSLYYPIWCMDKGFSHVCMCMCVHMCACVCMCVHVCVCVVSHYVLAYILHFTSSSTFTWSLPQLTLAVEDTFRLRTFNQVHYWDSGMERNWRGVAEGLQESTGVEKVCSSAGTMSL